MSEEREGPVLGGGGNWTNPTDVWPGTVPVECLLSGINPADTHLIFGNGHIHHQQFRNTIHPNNAPHLLLNTTIGTHSLLEPNLDSNNPPILLHSSPQINPNTTSTSENGQDPLSRTVLDEESEDSSEEDDDSVQQLSLTHSVPCGERHHHLLSPEQTPHLSPLFFHQGPSSFEPPFQDGQDPNTGSSVYGKLYYERERVVLHLKQWIETEDPNQGQIPTIFRPTNSRKNAPQPCPLCRLRSPHSHQNSYVTHKEGHRHTFKGVYFTFEESILIELYPEPSIGRHQEQHTVRRGSNGSSLLQNIPTYSHQPEETEPHLQTPQPLHHIASLETESKGEDAESAWWDDFEQTNQERKETRDSSQDGTGEEGEVSLIGGRGQSSCMHQEEPIPFSSQAQEDSAGGYRREQDSIYLTEQGSKNPDRIGTLLLIPPNSPIQNNLSTPINQTEGEQDEHLNFESMESTEQESNTPPLLPSQPNRERVGKYPCPSCPRRLPLKKTLRTHLETEHESNPFRCITCYLQFTDQSGLNKHLSTHKDKNGLESVNEFFERNEREEKGVKMEKRLNEKRMKRKGESDSFEREKSSKPLFCNICGKHFSLQRRLDTHRLSHQSDKSSQCDKCGKRFARKDKLLRHMYVHSEEKMFSCSVCDKRFSRRDKLTDHIKSHGGPEETHHCPECSKEFLRPDILKQHLKLHGMRNKHQCTACLRFVTGKERLDQHMARHEEAKALGQPLLCPLCTKNFIQRQSLKAHVKKFHPSAYGRLLPSLECKSEEVEEKKKERSLRRTSTNFKGVKRKECEKKGTGLDAPVSSLVQNEEVSYLLYPNYFHQQ